MKMITAYIDSKQQEFNNHPFFKLLDKLQDLEEISYFVAELTFWAMTFQDILRINEQRITDPYLKKVARHHRLEDAGHEKWFLHDKEYMSAKSDSPYCGKDSVTWLYGKEMEPTRDAAYEIVSEIYQTDDQILNVALLLTLESSGHVFFERVVQQVKKTGEDNNLKYFSSTHLNVELAHAVFEENMERELNNLVVPVHIRRKAFQMIERCYAAFNKMFDGLTQVCEARLRLAQQRRSEHAPATMEHPIA